MSLAPVSPPEAISAATSASRHGLWERATGRFVATLPPGALVVYFSCWQPLGAMRHYRTTRWKYDNNVIDDLLFRVSEKLYYSKF